MSTATRVRRAVGADNVQIDTRPATGKAAKPALSSRRPAAAPKRSAAGSSEQTVVYSWSYLNLGGKKFSQHAPTSQSEVHAAIVKGVRYGSLLHLVDSIKWLDETDIAKVLGVSPRTLRRKNETPDKAMPPDLASKAWLLSETLSKATEIFGGKDEAEQWMAAPAIGLDNRRPIELLQTLQGAALVDDFLTRLEYGVYS